MQTLETPPISDARELSIDPKVKKLLDGPPSENYMHRQIQLAVEKFSIEHPSDTLNNQLLHDVMTRWQGSEYSEKWRSLVQHPDFMNHPRFQGKLANVHLADLEEFIMTEKLPE